MNNFKIGDKVTLKKGLIIGKIYGTGFEHEVTLLDSMRFKGSRIVRNIPFWSNAVIELISGFLYSLEMLDKIEKS